MRNWTLPRAEQLFNNIEQLRRNQIAAALNDAAFVAEHFPRHEFAARAQTGRLMARQNRLVDAFTA